MQGEDGRMKDLHRSYSKRQGMARARVLLEQEYNAEDQEKDSKAVELKEQLAAETRSLQQALRRTKRTLQPQGKAW